MLSNAHHLFQMIFASDGWLLDARYKTFDMFTFSFYRFFHKQRCLVLELGTGGYIRRPDLASEREKQV